MIKRRDSPYVPGPPQGAVVSNGSARPTSSMP
jgi:hypothetical protein